LYPETFLPYDTTRRTIIFTDMDGTLLDPETYSWAEAEPALTQCRRWSIPVILNTSKTRSEIDHFRQSIDLPWPYISENGGGIYIPPDCPVSLNVSSGQNKTPGQVAIGVSYSRLCQSLERIAADTGLSLTGFSRMSLDDIMALTGLKPEDAKRAANREYDEPFCLNTPGPDALTRLQEAADRLGLHITSGGRFYHLHGRFDKGTAVRQIEKYFREAWGPIRTIGLGDSDNDIPMLAAVDIPVWVAPQNHPAPENISHLRQSSLSGPRAWNQVVLSIINSSYSDR